jgi:signal transduction histidine kinase
MSSERVNLAQELHDGIAQDLVGLGFSIDAIIAHSTDQTSKEELRKIRFRISESIEKVRKELHALREPAVSFVDQSVPDRKYQLERVLSEILLNIQEHSKATVLRIEISDNGIGGAHQKEGHFGLIGVQERIKNLNGDINIESSHHGTIIGIRVALDG